MTAFDLETGDIDVLDQLKSAEIEASNWRYISSQQQGCRAKLWFRGFVHKSSNRMLKIADIIDSIDFSKLQKQNEVIAKELGYRGIPN